RRRSRSRSASTRGATSRAGTISARCVRAMAAAVTPWSAASRCAGVNCLARARRSRRSCASSIAEGSLPLVFLRFRFGGALAWHLQTLDPLAQLGSKHAELADLVTQAAHVLAEWRAFAEVANHFLATPPEPAVELAIDHALERRDRRWITDHRERLDGGG